MPPATPSPTGRRLRLALLGTLALVVVAGGLILVLSEGEPPGQVVHIEVLDRRGRPIEKAKAQATFAPGWHRVGAEGRLRLPGVALKAGESPTPEAVMAAVEVEAPWYGLRPGQKPEISRRPDGSWAARYVLDSYGRLRLIVLPTTLDGVRAWVEHDPAEGLVVPEEGKSVARVGQDVTWRVFGNQDSVWVRLEGYEGVAARRREIEAPGSGFPREVRLEAEPARPIRGQVVVVTEMQAPTLRGHVEVIELVEDGSEVTYDSVRIDEKGTFEVPFAGQARYRLQPVLGFVEVEPREDWGGEKVTFDTNALRPWVVVPVEAWGERRERATVRCQYDPEGESAHLPHGLHAGDDSFFIALPDLGRYRLRVRCAGDASSAPADGIAVVTVERAGPHPTAIELEEVAAAELRVRLVPRPGGVGGGLVRLLAPSERQATVLPRLGDTARIPNVRAGRARLVVLWNDPETALSFLECEISGDVPVTLEARGRQGGLLILPIRQDGRTLPTATHVLAWEEGRSPYGEVSGEVELLRLAGQDRWNLRDRLAPGAYRAVVRRADDPTRTTDPFDFTIDAGETTVVAVPVP